MSSIGPALLPLWRSILPLVTTIFFDSIRFLLDLTGIFTSNFHTLFPGLVDFSFLLYKIMSNGEEFNRTRLVNHPQFGTAVAAINLSKGDVFIKEKPLILAHPASSGSRRKHGVWASALRNAPSTTKACILQEMHIPDVSGT